jgi:colanic acid/amylovoran biosynthesis glycosyltransferase
VTEDPDQPGPGLADGRKLDGLRVCIIGLSNPMETFLDRLFTGLAARGAQLTLISRRPPPERWLASRSARWSFGPGPSGVGALAGLAAEAGPRHAARAASDEIRYRRARGGGFAPAAWVRRATADADVVYVPWINSLISRPDLLQVDAPILVSCRGRMISIDPWSPAHPGRAGELRLVFERVDRVHCVSQAILEEATAFGLRPGSGEVITPAVDPDVFRPRSGPRSPGPLRVVATGTLSWGKDQESALRGIHRALGLGADFGYTVLGDGPERDRFRFTAGELGLDHRVVMAGQTPPDEVARMLRDADVFLHTSSSEGISNAVLEAMASGLPVVTTDAGGMVELVRNEVDGLVVGVRDVAAIGAALHRLVAEPDTRVRLGAAARDRVVDRFRLDQQLDAFGALLLDTAGAT